MKSKKIWIIIIAIISLILLFPIPMRLKDGGSIRFQALLYNITIYHQLNHQVENGYVDGIGIEILGAKVLNTTEELLFEKCGENEPNDIQTYNSFVGTILEETTTYIFEISVKESENKKKTKILNNTELDKNNSDYDLYYYGLDEVNVFVDNKTISLEEALRSGKMTIDGILVKANQDVSDGKIKCEMFKDGGTTEWYYNDYNIVKKHTLSGNRDVYILRTDLTNRDI